MGSIQPKYSEMHKWESYAADLMIEYRQCIEEGKDVKQYENLFKAIYAMPAGEEKTRMADVLFDVVTKAGQVEGYAYEEPSDLEGIFAQRPECGFGKGKPDADKLADKIHGAWLGRVCGCMLGKPIEGIRTNELHPLLKDSGNWPMHRYILSGDITDEIQARSKYPLKGSCWVDTVECMPADDDTNYMVLAQVVVEKYGRDFKPEDMMQAWLDYQPKGAYCTAERTAFCNFVKGFRPPESAIWQNPYREWIGAQIRGDYFGYINPGDPETAAVMAWRDASISHIKNGIYGEMFASAMIAAAAVESDIEKVLLAGLAQIPQKSRLYEAVMDVINDWKSGMTADDCMAKIHRIWNENEGHDWCHTISNAMIVAAALLYGEGDYGKTICLAVQTGFDTDCNGATVGSVVGMIGGTAAIGKEWSDPINDMLDTNIFGVGRVKISEMAKKTMDHMA